MPTDVQRLAQRILEDEEFRERMTSAASVEDRLAIARAEGYEPDLAEAEALKAQVSGRDELTADELAEIVGGLAPNEIAAIAGGGAIVIQAAAAAAI